MKPDQAFWKGRRVLITGHTGFKGSWLNLWLQELGADVYGMSLPPEQEMNNTCALREQSLYNALTLATGNHSNHHFGDIRDPAAVAAAIAASQPQVVLHLAAQPLVRSGYLDPVGTWSTNVQGSLHLLEGLRALHHHCAVVMVTTDKVYANEEWDHGYRENDRLGGHDPYSASKAAAELAIESWRSSFCGLNTYQTPHLAIATARAGNVIGGGDWATDRVLPDTMRALAAGETIRLRNPTATRPWQHVLEPLSGYLRLAERLAGGSAQAYASAFNFGPCLESNRSVRELVEAALEHWPGSWRDCSNPDSPHEAGRLHLQIDKAHHQLNWQPRWGFATTVSRTVGWYHAVHEGACPLECCLEDLWAYQEGSIHDV